MKTHLARTMAVAAGFSLASIALAQAPAPPPPAAEQAQNTPFNYALDSKGNRVPKGNRVTNPDGSWREEIRQGKCTTIKEMSADGVYKETHSC